MAVIVLFYNVNNPPNVSQARTVTKMGAVQLFEGELELLGMDVIADVTVPGPTVVQRLIVLLTTPEGDIRFPTDDAKKFATRGLYRQALGMKLPGRINAAEPIVF
jgi:hypothetical protein